MTEGWFGKGCIHQCCQWEETAQTGGPDYKENTPVLVFCGHGGNPEDTEGNCRPGICPIGLEIGEEPPRSNPRTNLSKKSEKWCGFSEQVINHLEKYVVPQYGDDGDDPATEYDFEDCCKQAERYLKRRNSSARPGQEMQDLLKSAHWIQMAADRLAIKLAEQAEQERRDAANGTH